MSSAMPTYSELGERLAGAQGHQVQQEVLAELAKLETRLAARTGTLVPRDEFAALSASLDAARAAQRVLDAWVPAH